jgi:hypothetical protein
MNWENLAMVGALVVWMTVCTTLSGPQVHVPFGSFTAASL